LTLVTDIIGVNYVSRDHTMYSNKHPYCGTCGHTPCIIRAGDVSGRKFSL